MPLNNTDSFYKAQIDKLSSLKSEKILDNVLRGLEKEIFVWIIKAGVYLITLIQKN